MGELPDIIFRAYKLGNEIIASASPEHKAEYMDLRDCLKNIGRKIEITLERKDVISALDEYEYESGDEQLFTHADFPTVILLDDKIMFDNKAIRFSEWVLRCSIEEYLESKETNNA